jgi:hypothetical protein
MATPQSPEQMSAMVDGIAAKQMGVAPEAPVAPAKEAPKPESAQGKAAEKGSPETEGDKVGAEAVIYEINFGENDNRKLTPQQIKSTFDRYSAMNYKNAQYKPVMDLIEKHMQQSGENPKQMAERMLALQKAQQSNPQMGNTEGDKSGPPYEKATQKGDLDSTLSKWEEENAASLPPGYRDMMVGSQQQMQSQQGEIAQIKQMLNQVLAQSQGNVQAAREGMQQGQNSQVSAIRQQIANNIDRAQSALKLPDEKAQDFMTFAAERGFTMEDFADLQLTAKVMNDFKNNMDGPEMQRMRDIAQRRQAFTGSLGSTPAASGAAGNAEPTGDRFAEFTQNAMSKRGLG